MKFLKSLLLCVGLFILIGSIPVFSGGGQQRAQTAAVDESRILNPLGQLPLLRENVTISLGIIRSTLTPDLSNNYKTFELQRDSNITLDFVYYPASGTEALQRLEIEIMAGGDDLPDVITFGLDPITQSYYGSLGMFIPLNDYVENSSYWMKPLIEEIPFDPWQFVRSADGNIYSLFSFSGEYVTEVVSRMYINTAWLQEANLSMPRSTMEFENMLRAFQNRRPNADGRRTYPFIDIRDNVRQQRFLGPLLSPFVYMGGGANRWFYREPNGVVSPVFTTDGWRQGLTWIRSMVDQGLIDPLSFTQNRDQIMTIGSATNEHAFGASTFYPLNFISTDDPRSEDWALMGPIAGPRGGDPVPAWSRNMPWLNYNITKNARYPEAAFRLGDLMMGEKFSVISRFGEEGVDWVRPGPTDRTYFEQYPPYLIPILVWGVPTDKLWEHANPRILPYRIFNGAYTYGRIRHLELWNAVATAQSMPYVNDFNSIGTIVYSMDEWERIGEIRANVENYMLESYIRFVLRDMSLENDWDRYLADLNAMGLQTYIQTFRTALTRMSN